MDTAAWAPLRGSLDATARRGLVRAGWHQRHQHSQHFCFYWALPASDMGSREARRQQSLGAPTNPPHSQGTPLKQKHYRPLSRSFCASLRPTLTGALPDQVSYVPVGFQGQGSFHLHPFLRRNSYFILRTENMGSSQRSLNPYAQIPALCAHALTLLKDRASL